MSESKNITGDDIYVLGNICSRAVLSGYGDIVQGIINLIQTERPENAAAFLMQAIYLYSYDYISDAIFFLENSPAFEAKVNRDEALAFHIFLLQADSQFDRAVKLGKTYLNKPDFTSESANHTIKTVLDEIDAMSGKNSVLYN